MQLILTQDVPHLGSLGDEVRVKDGYARNFLLPRGMAIVGGSKNMTQVEHRRRQLEVLRQQAIEKARSESEKVGDLVFTVHAKAGLNGRLFGSVTNRDILAIFTEQGYSLDRRAITLHTPIRNVGAYTATVKLHTDVKVDISITVKPLLVNESGEPIEMGKAEAAPAEVGDSPAEEVTASADESSPPPGDSEGEPEQAKDSTENN